MTQQTHREETLFNNCYVHDAWQVQFQWPWGLLQQVSVHLVSPLCASATPVAHPEHVGTAPVLREHPPVYATEKVEGKKKINL